MANQESARRFAVALDHLGSGDPVVRVGSFAELDQLAAEDPGYAQAVADVVSAYLKMPFDPPRYDHLRQPALTPKVPDEQPMSQNPGFPELQVRLAAQAVLTRRLLPEVAGQADQDGDGHADGPNVLIDLTGATLVGISFAGRRLHDGVVFTNAHFHEEADFSSGTFAGGAWFKSAVFHGTVHFHETQFHGDAIFLDARFLGWSDLPSFQPQWPVGSANFGHAHFHMDACFDSSEFHNTVSFDYAFFTNADFLGTRFESTANFQHVTFESAASFDGASFARSPGFEGTSNFSGDVTVADNRVRW
jgi:Pentapeptide repeats (9 copies)